MPKLAPIFLAILASAGLPAQDHTWVPRATFTDEQLTTHTRYVHYYKGLRVWGSEGISHESAASPMVWDGPHPRSNWTLELEPGMDPAMAQRTALGRFGPLAVPPRILDTEEVVYESHARALLKDYGAAPPNAEDLLDYVQGVTQAFAFQVQAGDGSEEELVVDAATGTILEEVALDEPAPVPSIGSGMGRDRGYPYREFTLNQSSPDGGSTFQLLDLTRGKGGVFGGNAVTDMFGSTGSGPGELVSKTGAGRWGDGSVETFLLPKDSQGARTVAAEAAFGLQSAWDYFQNVHGRNGFDGAGTATYVRVHADERRDNAWWSPTDSRISISSSGKALQYSDLFTMGHEFTHGVIDKTSSLIYRGEPGGLNEATADIFGHLIETYTLTGGGRTFPKTKAIGDADWAAGVVYQPQDNGYRPVYLRNFQDPAALPPSVNAWQEGLRDLDVHNASGPMNRAFYFLSHGAAANPTGSNSAGFASRLPQGMTGIGNDKAARIWYQANAAYLKPGSDYRAARVAALRAAQDLYPDTSAGLSAESVAVRRAFGAINVGDPEDRDPVSKGLTGTEVVTGLAVPEGGPDITSLVLGVRTAVAGRVFDSGQYLVDGLPIATVVPSPLALPDFTFPASRVLRNGSHTFEAVLGNTLGQSLRTPAVTFDLDMNVSQLLSDPSLEGTVPGGAWVASPPSVLADGSFLSPAHTGLRLARFTRGAGKLYQQVTLPAIVADLKLSLWVKVQVASYPKSSDALTVLVRDYRSNATLATLATFSARNARPDWVRRTFDLTPYQGRSIELDLVSSVDPSSDTTFLVDDVNLTMGRTSAPLSVAVTPAVLDLLPGATSSTPIAAVVTHPRPGGSTAVTWAITEAGGGSLAGDNRYVAPANPGFYHLRAISVDDPSAFAEVSIRVGSLAFLVPSVRLAPAATLDLSLILQGNGLPGLSFTPEPGGGTVLGSIYTAPASPGTYRLTVTDGAIPPNTASLAITVAPPPVLAITPASWNTSNGNTYRFSATLDGTPTTAVVAMPGASGPSRMTFQGLDMTVKLLPGDGTRIPSETAVFQSLEFPGATATAQVTFQRTFALNPLLARARTGGTVRFTGVSAGNAAVVGGGGNGTLTRVQEDYDNAFDYTAPARPGKYFVQTFPGESFGERATVIVTSGDVAGVAQVMAQMADAYAPGVPVQDPADDLNGDTFVDDQDVAEELELLGPE